MARHIAVIQNNNVTSSTVIIFCSRFLYHFTGTRQTNRLDKPEWFYTQILAWAKESNLFVSQTFQSAALLAYQETLNVRVRNEIDVLEVSPKKPSHFSVIV